MDGSPVNHYKILNISENASLEEIKQARNKSALKNHADKGGATEMMQKINEAFHILSNPLRRRDYDLQRDDNDEFSFADGNIAENLQEMYKDLSQPELCKRTQCLPGGFKLSDDYISKIDFWKLQGCNSEQKKFIDPNCRTMTSMHGFQNPYQSPANTAMDAYQKFSGCISPNGYQPYFCTGEKNKAIDQQLASYFPLESSFTFKTLNLIDKNLLNSDLWNLPLPVYQNVNKYIANYKNDIYLICHLNNAKKSNCS